MRNRRPNSVHERRHPIDLPPRLFLMELDVAGWMCSHHGTEGESGADLVVPACVQMATAANEADAPDLTADWIEQVGSECGQTLEVSAEAIRAVKELTCLSRLCV